MSPLNPAVPVPPTKPTALDFAGRLRAEAIRVHEEARGELINDAAAEAAARAGGGDLETRIVRRAASLPIAGAIDAAFEHWRQALALVAAVALIVAALSGVTAARLVLGPPGGAPINFFLALVGLLGLPTLSLIAWLALMLATPRSSSASLLGRALVTLARRLTRRWRHDQLTVAATGALATALTTGGGGRWLVSGLSHALWLAFLSGVLATALLLLSAKQVSFTWETTILSERDYVLITEVLAIVPTWLGFPAPDGAEIAASRGLGPDTSADGTRRAWAGLLVGSLIAYGLAPRVLALAVSLAGWWRAKKRWRLDTSRLGFARLGPRLMPIAEPRGVVDPDTVPAPAPIARAPMSAPVPGAEGPIAIVGHELTPPEGGWPPPLAGVEWLDLGFVESRADRQRVAARLRFGLKSPELLVVVASLTTTPDRGARAFLEQLRGAGACPLALILTGGQALRQRGEGAHLSQRLDDWRALAAAAGLDPARVIATDLDHLTATSREGLAAWLGAGERKPRLAESRLEAAFTLIAEQVGRWRCRMPTVGDQAELQRAIAGLYDSRQARWPDLLQVGGLADRVAKGLDGVEGLKRGASGMIGLLPARLRANGAWLGAGATAGALACVAAATLVAPVAITALPAWAGLGAGLGALLAPLLRSSSPEADATSLARAAAHPNVGEAVAAAALFALVLELQGRGEAAITRLLDRVLDDEPPALGDEAQARAWLGQLRQRLDAALAKERA